MKRLMPRVNDIAFYAFSQAADYLAQGAVLIRQKPFYVAITRYFADDALTGRQRRGRDRGPLRGGPST
jgi:hypothetical protein